MMSYITRSRKYPYHTMDSFFGILKASYNWKSKEMGGYFMIGIFKRCKGGGECVTLLIWNFPGVSQECIP